MDDPVTPPQYFERSGTDPGLTVSASLPEVVSSEAPIDWASLSMPMVDHITELRNRILISAGTLALTLGVGFVYALPLIQVFQGMAPANIRFVQLAPGEVLISSLRVSFYVGFALALPVILYHVLRFVLPGLTDREKGMVTGSIIGGTLLFLAGLVFAYYFVVPSALGFLVDYGQSVAQTQLSIESYIGFCSGLLFMTGLMFELPMVLFLLSFTGLVTSEKLIREWRWAIVLIFIVAAIVTPTQDPFSMSLVGLAMVALYGLSILPIKWVGR
ncbi:twin-arginine translocase subunit TatC [Vampirovibrio chlorellavorus]|uniref:twin-arginine translocase subunit TatC n=1 Tax=Vampirovibrio chlorellavorus TaxID=758823 RepID=UPI0026E9408D|nr:twin-arginine translocase subunit TatC [Vampirovibrio chlorellavorus]